LTSKICPKCEAENKIDSKFCFNCGKPFVSREISNMMEPTKFAIRAPVMQERSATSKFVTTAALGLEGLAIAGGKQTYKQSYGYISTHEKGVQIDYRKDHVPNIRIKWDQIVGVKIRGVLTRELNLYTIIDRPFKIKFGPIDKLCNIIEENMCGVIPENVEEEGWD
jgi:hypothetical protein